MYWTNSIIINNIQLDKMRDRGRKRNKRGVKHHCVTGHFSPPNILGDININTYIIRVNFIGNKRINNNCKILFTNYNDGYAVSEFVSRSTPDAWGTVIFSYVTYKLCKSEVTPYDVSAKRHLECKAWTQHRQRSALRTKAVGKQHLNLSLIHI